MAFSCRRGRPRKQIPPEGYDLGTPELRQKRQLSLTTEKIDWLLEQAVITQEQHWCALHFRWLYTLRYGTPTPKSLSADKVRGIQHQKCYSEWQEEREEEWKQAVTLLTENQCLHAVSDCAIYNFYTPHYRTKIDYGLEKLSKLWCH